MRLLTWIGMLIVFSGIVFYIYARSLWFPFYSQIAGAKTLTEVMDSLEKDAKSRIGKKFNNAKLIFPVKKIALLGLKQEKQLEVWAYQQGAWHFVHSYKVTAASGVAGPKLREGDRQVPEGIYTIPWLNPNSSYHLSIKLNYPNKFDLKHANDEGRLEPGSDIFIHGKAVSIGCLAVGDEAIEELFYLTQVIGKENVKVIIAPHDPREKTLFPVDKNKPLWVHDLYRQIETAFSTFKK